MIFDRLAQFYDSATSRDVIEIAILTAILYVLLRLLGKTRGASIVRGLGLLVVGLFLVAQVVIASFDLKVLGRVLDYLLTTGTLGLLVIFQPELRRGLMLLGRYRMLRYFVPSQEFPITQVLADASESLSQESVGALLVIERETSLGQIIETGVRLDAEISSGLIRSIFSKRSPLHDGAVVISGGKLAAASCQLPLGQPPENATAHMGMRHRSALSLSEETDAVLLVVSEETGRISIAAGGNLEVVSTEDVPDRLEHHLRASNRMAISLTGPVKGRSAA